VIVDGHNYCVPQIDAPQGYPTLAAKMRAVQAELGGHHQPVWRVRDRAPSDNSTLIDPATGELRDVEWTRDLGRLAWRVDGETYTKQYLPPMLDNLECPPEVLIREMDYAGVDVGLLHTYPLLGSPDFLNGYLGDATSRFPDRLYRLVMLTEAAIPDDPDAAIETLRSEVDRGGVSGFQYIPGFHQQPVGGEEARRDSWDGEAMRPFWDAVAAMKLPVYFTLIGGRGSALYERSWQETYLDEQRVLMRWMERYPEQTVVITHGLPWRSFLDGNRIRFPEEIWRVFDSPRCHLQLLIPIQMGGMWEYPWTEAEPTVQECVERIGADRLIWGTDIPMVSRFCTYRQTRDQFRTHCDFLTEDERRDILGGTAARVMGLAGP
jgi:predicted TIM-barrel fold metal-dependent hydrolase